MDKINTEKLQKLLEKKDPIYEIPEDYFPNTDKRYKAPDENKNWEPKKMRENYKEIVRRVLLGEKVCVIAEAVGLSQPIVSKIRNSSMIQERLRLLGLQRDAHTVDIAKDIKNLAPKALEVLEKLMDKDSTNPNVRSGIARDILDRAGHGAVKKTESRNLHAHLTTGELEGIKQRALEAGKETGMITDIGEKDGEI